MGVVDRAREGEGIDGMIYEYGLHADRQDIWQMDDLREGVDAVLFDPFCLHFCFSFRLVCFVQSVLLHRLGIFAA